MTLANATITSGNGVVNSTTVSGNTVTVNLTASPGPQQIVIKLTSVNDSAGNVGDINWPFDVLLGDISGNRLVNSTDTSNAQAQSGVPISQSNFRNDINHNGQINSTDTSIVQSKSGTGLP